MSMGQVLLTLLIALLVFGPSKLPMLADHLGRLLSMLNNYKQQANKLWQAQLNEHHLQENKRKAVEADGIYQQDKMINENDR